MMDLESYFEKYRWLTKVRDKMGEKKIKLFPEYSKIKTQISKKKGYKSDELHSEGPSVLLKSLQVI